MDTAISPSPQVFWPKRPPGFGAAFHDLDKRISRRNRTPRPFLVRVQRMGEIEALIVARTGQRQLVTDDAEVVAQIAAQHIDYADAALSWFRQWLPHLPAAKATAFIAEAKNNPRLYRADTIAKLLNVTFDERQRLGLRTIGACDISKATRQKLVSSAKAERSRLRKEAQRRAEGIGPRAKGERAALQAAALGISARTLYRRKKRGEAKAFQANGPNNTEPNNGAVHLPMKPASMPAWLSRAFVGPCINIDDPDIPPEAIRIGAIVSAALKGQPAMRLH